MFPNLTSEWINGDFRWLCDRYSPASIGEVIDGVIIRIEKPEVTVDELMTVIKGPDFPTGGIIQGIDGIKKAYETGKGKIIIRGKTEIEDITRREPANCDYGNPL